MVLQHAVKHHEARDWIRLQDQSQLMYQALLSHCKMLEACCEQYQKAKERGHTNLASITSATSSLHIDPMSRSPNCCKCGYSHPNGKCPAKGQQCFTCGGFNHYTVLCQKKKGCRQSRQNKQQRGSKPSKHYSSHGHHTSCPPAGTTAEAIACTVIPGPLPTAPHIVLPMAHPLGAPPIPKGTLPPHRYFQESIDVIPANSITTGTQAESKLFTERASNGQVAFYTCLDLPAQSGTKTMAVKIDPGTQVNTSPLSRYCTLFPNCLNKSRYPKAKALMPTGHTRISHDGLPQPFLGHFIVEVAHAKEPRTYPVRFYVFEDTTNPPNLSYATLERLGIVQFQVPNLAATHSLDQVAVQTPGSKRKTDKQVTFQDPISKTEGSHTNSNPPDNCHGKRKTTVLSKGEEALTSSHSKTTSTEEALSSNHFKTTSTAKEVKVGSSIYSRTIPPPKVPNSPASKTIRHPTLAVPPSQCYQVHSPPP